jgi:hypothetical protein
MIEADDTIIINAAEWIPAERLHAALNNICPPGAAFGALNVAFEKAVVKSARVLLDELRIFSNSDTILVTLANAHDVGAATAQREKSATQIKDFIERYSVLRGRENSLEFCRERDLDADSGLPWLLIDDELGRRCVVYFWLEDVRREWPDISKEPPSVKMVWNAPAPGTPAENLRENRDARRRSAQRSPKQRLPLTKTGRSRKRR